MKTSESITKIAPALIKFNSEVGKIEKDGENPFLKNKYATLDKIIEVIRPVLSTNKLAVMQDVISGDGFMTVKTLLLHESGEWFESEGTTLRLVKNDPQGVGAGITYARRYDLSAFLSLNTGEDDDGNSQMNEGMPPENAITPKQVGELKLKISEFAKSYGKTEGEAYEALEITDITLLNRAQAVTYLKDLDQWIAESEKVDGQ